jgi:hypothetical protein
MVTNKKLDLLLGCKNNFSKVFGALITPYIRHNIYKGSVDGDPTDTQNLVTFEKNIIDKSADYFQFQMVNNIRLSAKKDWF